MKFLRWGLYVGGAVALVGGVVWFVVLGDADLYAIGGVAVGVALLVAGIVAGSVDEIRRRMR